MTRIQQEPLKLQFFCFALIFLVGLAGFGCSDLQEMELGTLDSAQTAAPRPDQESWNATIIITRDGRPVARIWAVYLASYNKAHKTELRDSVVADFFDSRGRHASRLTAEEGTIFQKMQNFVARGHVVVVSDSGVVLRTEELHWDKQRQKIHSELPVTFTTPTDTLIGDRFISDPDLTHYEIYNARGVTRRLLPLKKDRIP